MPFTAPAAVGVTATVKFPDWPVPSDIGKLAPGRVNCGLENVACVIESAELPVFEIATVCVLCFPTVTLPKLMLVGLS